MLKRTSKPIITYSDFRRTETQTKDCVECGERFIISKFGDGILVNGKVYFDCPYCEGDKQCH